MVERVSSGLEASPQPTRPANSANRRFSDRLEAAERAAALLGKPSKGPAADTKSDDPSSAHGSATPCQDLALVAAPTATPSSAPAIDVLCLSSAPRPNDAPCPPDTAPSTAVASAGPPVHRAPADVERSHSALSFQGDLPHAVVALSVPQPAAGSEDTAPPLSTAAPPLAADDALHIHFSEAGSPVVQARLLLTAPANMAIDLRPATQQTSGKVIDIEGLRRRLASRGLVADIRVAVDAATPSRVR
jgi:hypothetical protein